MKNVTRTHIPESLKKNSARWKIVLLNKIDEMNGNVSSVPDNYFGKYNKPDVKDALKAMYNQCCCYCEGQVGVVDFPHIEHRKPKKVFPDETYEWGNLHLACEQCNVPKGDQYDDQNPILDAVNDVPITAHLTYDLAGMGVWRFSKTQRGNTTIEHTKLNRDGLKTARLEVLLIVLKIIGDIKNDPSNPGNNVKKQQLNEMCKGSFGSLIKYAMDTYLKDED